MAQASKSEGVCARVHALWATAGDGTLLPRSFAIALAVAEGINPSTARTQYQVAYKRAAAALQPTAQEPTQH
jgi:hypothetical protein